MERGAAECMVARLLSCACDLKYGAVSVTVKVHGGQVVQVIYSTTENTREAVVAVDDKK